MPPKRTQSSRNSIEKEGRILLAIQAIQKQEIASIREAARQFNIPRSTLTIRLNGVQNRASSRVNNLKLTEIEEESLQKWILSIDLRGAAPRPSTVREIADLLLAARGSTPLLSVGENWVTKLASNPIISVLKTVQFRACAMRRPEDYWRLVFSRLKDYTLIRYRP
jgi:hypothetical protein